MPEKRLNFSDGRPRKSRFNFPFLLIVSIVIIGLYVISRYIKPEIQHQAKNSRVEYPVNTTDSAITAADTSELELELPVIHPDDEIVRHHNFTLCYSEPDEEPAWVAYVLKASYIGGHEKRPEGFRPDPLVVTGSATTEDYIRSGYDRGHQVPAADMKWSRDAIEETFYMSNVCPQNHGFNDGIWEDLEESVRHLALRDGKLYVIVGPVLKGHLKKIGRENKVSVPEYFYKVILDTKASGNQPISAFIIPNKDVKQPFWNYSVSLDSVERMTGIRFFPKLRSKINGASKVAANTQLWQGL